MSTVSLPVRLRARSALGERVRGLDAAWTCLVAVVTTRTVAALALGVRPLDDAYITYRYALNLGDGHGFVYNVGDHVLGTTTPLWAAILGAAHWVGLSLPATSLVLALACDVGTALLLRSLLDRLG